jgi:MFS family permease
MIAVSVTHIFFKGPIDQVYPIFVISRFIFGAGMALGIVAGLTMAADLAPPSKLTQGLGFFGIMPLVGIAIGPVVAENIVNRGGVSGMFLTALAIFGAAFLALIPLRDRFIRSGDTSRGNFLRAFQIPLVWRMSIICLCFGVAFAAHGSFVAPFAKTNGLSVSAYFAAYSAAAVLSRIFGGNLASRFGEVQIIPVALVIGGIGFVCLTGVSTTPGLAGTGFVSGLGHGLLFPSLMGLTMRPIPSGNRGKVTGILTGGTDLGMFIGAMLMGQLGELFGFSIIFGSAAATLFLGLGIFFRIRPMIISR